MCLRHIYGYPQKQMLKPVSPCLLFLYACKKKWTSLVMLFWINEQQILDWNSITTPCYPYMELSLFVWHIYHLFSVISMLLFLTRSLPWIRTIKPYVMAKIIHKSEPILKLKHEFIGVRSELVSCAPILTHKFVPLIINSRFECHL